MKIFVQNQTFLTTYWENSSTKTNNVIWFSYMVGVFHTEKNINLKQNIGSNHVCVHMCEP